MSGSATQQAIVATYEQTIGRDPSPTELAYTEQQLASGIQLTAIRDYLVTTGYATNALAQLYDDVVGRAITAPEQASDEAGLAAGGSLQGLRSYFATTAEAAGKLAAVYTGVLGRAITAGEMSGDEAAIGAGTGTLGSLRAYLSTTAEAVGKLQAVYTDVLGRPITASEQSGDEAVIGAGTATLQSLRDYLATTNEALGKLQSLYTTELDRGITIPEVQGDERAIAGGSSLAAIRGYLSTSHEAVRAITSQFHSAFGYDVDNAAPVPQADLASAEAALARGTSLASAIAQTPAAISLIGSEYQTLLGTTPTAGELQAGEHDIAAVLGTTPVADYPSVADTTMPLVLAAQNGPEVATDITAAFQDAAGRAPTAVELAADRSELQAGYNIGAITAQIGRIGDAAPLSAPANGDYILKPQTIVGSPSFIYGLFNNDALVASQSGIGVAPGVQPTEAYLGKTAADTVVIGGASGPNFDPATDFFQIAKAQASSFNDLKLTSATTPSGNIPYTNVSAGAHLLLSVFVPDGSLTAANFKFS